MKLYVVVELGYVYNDEYWRREESEGGKPVAAYKVKANAEAAAFRMNKEKAAKRDMEDDDGKQITDLYDVAEIEVADEDVATAGEDDYESAKAGVAAARKKAKDAAQRAFRKGADGLFASMPDLQSFGWTQYTPYFNDGDECVFGVRADEPDINGVDGYDVDSGYGRDPQTGQYGQVREPSLEHKLQSPVADFIAQFSDEDMKEMFGDHVRVTVPRAGEIVIDGYEHD